MTFRIESKKHDLQSLEDEVKRFVTNISDLEESLSSETDISKKAEIAKKISRAYDAIDEIQEQTYKLMEIPDKRHKKMAEARDEIIEQYKGTGMLDDVFISHADESIQVILSTLLPTRTPSKANLSP